MALPLHRQAPPEFFASILGYSCRYLYPLTLREIWFWQIRTSYSLKIISSWLSSSGIRHQRLGSYTYYFLPGGEKLPQTRVSRSSFSRPKWEISQKTIDRLQKNPFISAIFVTGSLSMNNSPSDDDIDLMIITKPHTLWLVRLWVVCRLLLSHSRRPPALTKHSSPQVSNKICDNLYLDEHHLHISPAVSSPARNLYLAHEILQAVPLLDHGGIAQRFLAENSWIGEYLPVAYTQSLKKFKNLPDRQAGLKIDKLKIIFWPFNMIAFTLQYLYMLPRRTGEKIGLGFAFFHPHPVRA